MIDLKPFCSKDETRLVLLEPSSQAGFTYATDGRIIIEVPLRSDVPEVPRYPVVAVIMESYKDLQEWVLIPENLPVSKEVKCEDCEGCGACKCDMKCEHECDGCDGTGLIEEVATIDIGNRRLNTKYLILIQKFPSVKINISGISTDLVSFKFEGGRGLIAPINRD